MRDCPLTVARERLKLTKHELAQASFISYTRVADAEAGRLPRIPVQVIIFLRDCCEVDVTLLRQDFTAWYVARGDDIRRRVQEESFLANPSATPDDEQRDDR